MRGRKPSDPQVRFWSKVQVGLPDECWPINLANNQRSGHRRFQLDGRPQPAHRVAWRFSRGPIPDGLCVCHTCDNPPCMNPGHLWLGTVGENNADRDAKGRGRLPREDQMRRQTAGPIKHGTIYAYIKRKCRCADCREAMRLYRNRPKESSC